MHNGSIGFGRDGNTGRIGETPFADSLNLGQEYFVLLTTLSLMVLLSL
jgi:hypothetical protein